MAAASGAVLGVGPQLALPDPASESKRPEQPPGLELEPTHEPGTAAGSRLGPMVGSTAERLPGRQVSGPQWQLEHRLWPGVGLALARNPGLSQKWELGAGLEL